MASTYLTRNMTTQGSSIKGTFSCWFKLASDNLTGGLLSHYFSTSYLFDICLYNANIEVADYRSNAGGYLLRKRTTAKYRDLNAWYHLYVAIDRSLGTAEDRCKIYVNGDRVTDFLSSENANYSQQTSGGHSGAVSMNNDYTARVGVRYDTTYFDGSISHMHWVDGSVIDIAQFGSTDSTTGEWKINTSPTVADYGTNGFFILKDGNTITDQSSGGSYDFTVGGGTLTKTEDCPSSVFATLNPLNAVYISFLQGNNTISGGNNGTDYSYIGSTLAANSGKFYWEVKAADLAEIDQVGVALASSGFSNIGTSHGLQGTQYGGKGVQFSNGYKVGDGSGGAYMGGFSTDDIMMVALDLDNTKITFGKNGQWSNGSGGADQTYANSTAAFTNLTAGEYYMPAHAMRGSGGNTGISRYNFGNGYFATTAVSSAGTNASNNGIFEYDVPTGFTALSTKGLNL